MGDDVGVVLAVLNGWEKETLDGTSLFVPGEQINYEVESLE